MKKQRLLKVHGLDDVAVVVNAAAVVTAAAVGRQVVEHFAEAVVLRGLSEGVVAALSASRGWRRVGRQVVVGQGHGIGHRLRGKYRR